MIDVISVEAGIQWQILDVFLYLRGMQSKITEINISGPSLALTHP